jgi:hypothetical protein
MAYPENILPTFELVIPSNQKKLAYRPYTVAQEKVLLMAAEAGDAQTIHAATKQAVSECIIDKSVDVGKLAPFDVDYIFAHMRAKSVSETAELDFTCHNKVNKSQLGDFECGGQFTVTVNINDVKVIINEARGDKIDLGNGLIVETQYPTYDSLRNLSEDESELQTSIKLIASSIKGVSKGAAMVPAKDVLLADSMKFIESLTKAQYEKLKTHVEDVPHFEVKTKAKCPHCQFEHEIKFTDITSFF